MHSPEKKRNLPLREQTVRKSGNSLGTPGGGPFPTDPDRCPACGSPLEPAARFCGECGAPVTRPGSSSGTAALGGTAGAVAESPDITSPGVTRRLPSAPGGSFDEEEDLDRMAAYRAGLTDEIRDRLEERLETMGRLLFRDRTEARTSHDARRPAGAVGWVCNANGYLHPSPAQCRNAHRGGRWVTEWEGITRPEEIPWDTIEE